MIENPYTNAKEISFTLVAPGQYRAKIGYLSAKEVTAAVDKIFLKTEMGLAKASTLEDRVGIIQKMKKDLISVHPFLDGNGRTIRLVEDFLLSRYGLPPSLFPNESDLLMSIPEATEHTRREMIRYVNEYAGH